MVLGTKTDLIQNFDPEIASGPLRAVMQEFDLPFAKRRLLFASTITQSGVKVVRTQIVDSARELSKESKVSASQLASAVMQAGAVIFRAQRSDLRLVMQTEKAALQLFPTDVLAALHDRGLLLWERDAELVRYCSILSLSLFLFFSIVLI